MKMLVVGCDASGKSTLVRELRQQYGGVSIESSRSIEALEFKARHLRTKIDAKFINEREAFYLQLEAEEQSKTIALVGNLVTTNSTLVTRLAHAVMRTCINEPALSNEAIIANWQNDERRFGTPLPDTVILTHADPAVIRQRMIARQATGRSDEAFWGFNSPFFLERYQARWTEMLTHLGNMGLQCIEIDTSIAS